MGPATCPQLQHPSHLPSLHGTVFNPVPTHSWGKCQDLGLLPSHYANQARSSHTLGLQQVPADSRSGTQVTSTCIGSHSREHTSKAENGITSNCFWKQCNHRVQGVDTIDLETSSQSPWGDYLGWEVAKKGSNEIVQAVHPRPLGRDIAT